MAVYDPWAIDASGGLPAYSAQEARILSTAPFVAGSSSGALTVRGGIRQTGNSDLRVLAQASPNMTVKINPGTCVVQGAISSTQGPYCWALDSVTNATVAASHATLDRTDLVCVRIRDANVDTSGARDGGIIVITGTAGGGVPAIPTDASYLLLAQISVIHAVTSITSGAITDKRTFTAGVGGVIYSNGTTDEGAANTVAPGQPTYRSDLGVAARRYSDGTNWQTAPTLLGGNKWTGGGNFVTGLVGTELTCMTGPSLALPANSTIVISVGVRLLDVGAGTLGTYVLRIRDTNVSGTERGEFTWTAQSTSFGYNAYFTAFYETTSAASVVWVVTAQRVGGTNSLSMIAGPTQHNTHIAAYVVAPSATLTAQATP